MNNKEQSQQQPEEQTGTVNIYGIYVEGKRELTDGQEVCCAGQKVSKKD